MTNLDPIALTINGSHKTWWRIGAAIVVVLGLLVAYGGGNGNLSLDVSRNDWLMRDDGLVLNVINAGTGPITITKLSVNGREDCKLFSLLPNKEASELLPYELKVGGQFKLNSSCRLIRVEISTNSGSGTYEFGG